MNGHSLKLHFCIFEKSQRKHNSLDCHKSIWNIFHSIEKFTCSSVLLTLKVIDSENVVLTFVHQTKCCSGDIRLFSTYFSLPYYYLIF